MWWQSSSSRLDRIEANMERIDANMERIDARIERLAEISEATNRRIDRFVEATAQQIEESKARTAQLQQGMDQLQRAVGYLLSQDH
jgi:methyl-accepting chemotaxis protein